MKKTNILLVDDEVQFVSALAERLSMRGFEAEWATTGAKALEKAKNGSFELAILDVKMPSISGLELKKKIEDISPDTRFIFFTGHGSEQSFRDCTAQAQSVLVKPLKIEELIATIHIVMEKDSCKV